jgi:small subunit ribosomal protein S17
MSNETVVAPAAVAPRRERQTLTGVVTSAKMQKTIVVKVSRKVRHPMYHRVVRHNKKYYAHDEKNEAHVGDTVRLVSTRPLSKLKRWRLTEIVARSRRA